MKRIQPLKGTRDFYPEQKRVLNFIINTWEKVAKRYGYEDFDGPMLEPAQLWQMKSGQEIPEQMYVFEDKGGRVVAVRPELTPTLARMIAQKSMELSKPIKWYSTARCWRYEAPQTGRLREFFQFNIDCLGTDNMLADAEVVATAITIMQEFGCDKSDFYIRLCNRKLIQAVLESFQIKKIPEVMRIIDKKDKVSEKNFKEMLKEYKLSESQIKDVLEMTTWTDLYKAKKLSLSEEGKKGLEELEELMKYLKAMKLDGFVKIDFSIMRGFDYYTSTVFEVFDQRKKFRAIAGGGRYDDLVKDFGSREKVSGVGYGMGDVVLELFLKEIKKLPEISREIDYFVAYMKPELVEEFLPYMEELRKKFSVDLDLMQRGFNKQMSHANKVGAKKTIILAPKEWEKGEIIIKDMKTGKQEVKNLKRFLREDHQG